MPQGKSKYKNPDKLIRQLRAELICVQSNKRFYEDKVQEVEERYTKLRNILLTEGNMREIKFRYTVTRKNGYVFHQVFTIEEMDDGAVAVWKNVNNINGNDIQRTQYTGLKDKNGKEIYEGDIVETWFPSMPHNIRTEQEVMFVDGCFGCGDYPLKHIDLCCEVIGNIYENLELLED